MHRTVREYLGAAGNDDEVGGGDDGSSRGGKKRKPPKEVSLTDLQAAGLPGRTLIHFLLLTPTI